MAKIQEITTFEDLVEFQRKLNPNSDRMDLSTYSDVEGYIHTGSYILNACISGRLTGGIPLNKIVAFAGDSQTGKTLSCLNIARSAQKMGYNVVYYDTENAVTEDTMTAFGVDPKRVLYNPISVVEDLKHNLVQMLNALMETKKAGKEVPKLLIVIDSLSQLGTLKSEVDADSGKNITDMTRAKAIKNMFQLITNKIGYLKYPMIFTNHTYENIGGFLKAHEKIKITGGKAIEYTASVIIHYSRTQLDVDKGKSEKTGITVIAQPLKNRLVKPMRVSYQIPWNRAINPFIGLEQFIEISDAKLAAEIWEKVGLGRGTMKTNKNGDIEFAFKPKSTTWAVRHLDENVKRSEASRIFSEEIFTSEVIKNLDEFVYREFAYSNSNMDSDYIDDLNSMLSSDNEEIY